MTASTTAPGFRSLVHNRVRLALHTLRDGDGQPLLLLHGLGERSPATLPPWLEGWPGAVFALDFTGHGESTVPRGGGYTCEVLMADTDIALAETGPATVLGRGLGAWVALLIAGARPPAVRGAILADGPGLAGGGPAPGSSSIVGVESGLGAPDPLVLAELSRDVRPPDYATSFVRLAMQRSEVANPITVTAKNRPPWLAAVAGEPGVQEATLVEALELYRG